MEWNAVRASWRERYRTTLLDQVIPFWMRYSLDPETGAISNCLDDDGTVLSRDRYLWSQGRALWTFSALYNRVEPRPEWLAVARGLFGYLREHGRDDRGYWMFRLDAEGNVLETDSSIYVDAFVMNGMGEFYLATRDPEALIIARQTHETTLARLRRPGSYRIAPYAIPPGMKALGLPMIFSFFYDNLGRALARPDISEAGHALGREVLDDFYQAEGDAIREFVSLEGRPVDTPEGRVCIPGHGLEALWFLTSIYEQTGERERLQRCCALIRRELELGWDDEYGGLRLAIDVAGRSPVAWQQPDCKPWWVQLEAMVATVYAYLHTGDTSYLDWHQRIADYTYAHYPTPAGEWVQWLDRVGSKTSTAALPVKDPFHLPRALIYLLALLERDPVGA